jgi:hypothetical protein
VGNSPAEAAILASASSWPRPAQLGSGLQPELFAAYQPEEVVVIKNRVPDVSVERGSS